MYNKWSCTKLIGGGAEGVQKSFSRTDPAERRG